MKIIVAIKQVPERDAPVRIAASGKAIEEAGREGAARSQCFRGARWQDVEADGAPGDH